MATDINQYHLDAAGCVMRELRRLPGHFDAQVTLAMVVAYISTQYEIDPGTFCQVLLNNVNQIGGDPMLFNRVTERVHTISTAKAQGSSILLPQ